MPGGRHAGNRANAIEQRREERVDLLRRAVRTRGQRDARGHHVRGSEAEVDLLERPQRAQHQAGARQQQQRERELDDDERAAESQPVAARRHLRAAVPETADEADPERAKCRRQTAEQRGHGARRDEKQRDVPVHRDGRRARNRRRPDRVEHALGAKGERQSRDAAGDRQERAFDELLTHQPPAIRAERRARRELALSGFRARQQNRAGVGARDEHQEADGTQQDVERPPDAAEDLVLDRHGERREVHLRRVLTFGRERRRDRGEIVGRLRGGHAGLEPARGVEAVAAALGLLRIEVHRHPQLRRLRRVVAEIGRELEAARHHADDLCGPAVEIEVALDRAGIAAELPLPEAVAEDDEHRLFGAAARAGFVFGVGPSEDRPHAEDVERVRGRERRADADGVARAGEGHARDVPRGDPAHRAVARLVVEDFLVGHPRLVEVGPAAPDRHEAVGIAVGERRDEHAADDRVHRGGRADAEAQREHDDGDGARLPAESAQAGEHVTPPRVQHLSSGRRQDARLDEPSALTPPRPGGVCDLRERTTPSRRVQTIGARRIRRRDRRAGTRGRVDRARARRSRAASAEA